MEDIKTKTRPAFLAIAQGTALGTTLLDTSGYQYAQFMGQFAGAGSRTIRVYANAGTRHGTAGSTMPDPVFVGSATGDSTGAGSPVWLCGSLTHQAAVCIGTSVGTSFTLSYMFCE